MAMKKASNKGDEPVRMGRAKTQRTKGMSKSSRSTNDLAGRSGKGFVEGYGFYDSAPGRTSRRETNQGKRSAVKKSANIARVVKQKQR